MTDKQIEKVQPDAMMMSVGGIVNAAMKQGVKGDDLSRYLAFSREMEQDRDRKALADALVMFQSECPRIKRSRNVAFKTGAAYSYASYDDIMAVVQPILQKHGISVSFDCRLEAGMMACDCILRLGTWSERYGVSVSIPKEMRVNDTQKMGAAMSYAKRYALVNALNIVVTDEDTDGAYRPDKTITQEQADSIRDMVESIPAGSIDMDSFWRFAEADCYEAISEAKRRPIIGMLKARIKTLEDKGVM